MHIISSCHLSSDKQDGLLAGYLNFTTNDTSFFYQWKVRYAKLVFHPTTSTLSISKSANVPALHFINLTHESKVNLTKHRKRICLCLSSTSPTSSDPPIYLSPMSVEGIETWLDALREGIRRASSPFFSLPRQQLSLSPIKKNNLSAISTSSTSPSSFSVFSSPYSLSINASHPPPSTPTSPSFIKNVKGKEEDTLRFSKSETCSSCSASVHTTVHRLDLVLNELQLYSESHVAFHSLQEKENKEPVQVQEDKERASDATLLSLAHPTSTTTPTLMKKEKHKHDSSFLSSDCMEQEENRA